MLYWFFKRVLVKLAANIFICVLCTYAQVHTKYSKIKLTQVSILYKTV